MRVRRRAFLASRFLLARAALSVAHFSLTDLLCLCTEISKERREKVSSKVVLRKVLPGRVARAKGAWALTQRCFVIMDVHRRVIGGQTGTVNSFHERA